MDWIKAQDNLPDLYSHATPSGGNIYYSSDYVYVKTLDDDIYIAKISIEGSHCGGIRPDKAIPAGKDPVKFNDVVKRGYDWQTMGPRSLPANSVKEWKPLEEKIKWNKK